MTSDPPNVKAVFLLSLSAFVVWLACGLVDGFGRSAFGTGNDARGFRHRGPRSSRRSSRSLTSRDSAPSLRSSQQHSSRRSSSSPRRRGSSPRCSRRATRCSPASSAHGCRFCRFLRRRISREPGSSRIPDKSTEGQPEQPTDDPVSSFRANSRRDCNDGKGRRSARTAYLDIVVAAIVAPLPGPS